MATTASSPQRLRARLRNTLRHIWPYRLLRGVVGLLFIIAGTNKLLDLETFAYTIWEYNLLDEAYIDFVAYSLPVVEVLAGIGLFFNVRGSLTAVTGMLVFFIGILWWGILEGLAIDCGCFGTSGEASPQSLKDALVRDLYMLAACVYCYIWRVWRRDVRMVPDPVTWLWRRWRNP